MPIATKIYFAKKQDIVKEIQVFYTNYRVFYISYSFLIRKNYNLVKSSNEIKSKIANVVCFWYFLTITTAGTLSS